MDARRFTIVDPGTTWVNTGVTLAADVEIGPDTQLEGSTTIAAGARFGPGCLLRDTTVGAGATVTHAVCRSAEIGAGATEGPFAYLPPGSKLEPGGHAGGQAAVAVNGIATSEGAQDA